jgi:hypothetical protein
MNLPRLLFSITLTLACLVGIASSQSSRVNGLSFTGAVVSVTPDISTESTRPFVVYEIALQLQLRNDGPKTLILMYPLGCERRLEFLSSATFQSDEPADLTVTSWEPPERYRNEDYRFFEQVANDRERAWIEKLLVTPNPADAGLLMLEPGKVYEFRDVVKVNAAFSMDARPGQTYEEFRRNTPKSQFAGLRIHYTRSLKHGQIDSILRAVKEKWKAQGVVLISDAGEFTIKSETILNRTN